MCFVVCQNNCSDHGQCDQATKRCICSGFWMENFFLANFGERQSNCGICPLFLKKDVLQWIMQWLGLLMSVFKVVIFLEHCLVFCLLFLMPPCRSKLSLRLCCLCKSQSSLLLKHTAPYFSHFHLLLQDLLPVIGCLKVWMQHYSIYIFDWVVWFFTRDSIYAIARLCDSDVPVRPSVSPSVTRRYCA